ncbi:dienelactone hydrolase family protein [Actinocrispum sp. NPDC049592]|uniref:dienelactone hydrolase family protein n=1 Tax=Actinocrispum sp. NPDC049592 TaxID=3154835 RepID=UPI00343581AB
MRVWLPENGRGHGVLLLQEIFGVGEYIEAVAADLTSLGYVVGAPDLFWRVQPGWRGEHSKAGMAASMTVASQFDLQTGIADSVLALDHLAGLPEVDRVGVLGFCLGGTVAFGVAARTKPSAVVSFYGSGVPDMLHLAGEISSPLQLHFGGQDPYIPAEKVAAVAEAVAGRDTVELHIQPDGGHAFHNRVSEMFYQPEPAERAWRLTEEFLRRYL